MVTSPLRIGLIGATGRLGCSVRRLMQSEAGLCLTAVLHRAGHETSITGVAQSSTIGAVDGQVDVWIDFSAPAACADYLGQTARPCVIASTGLQAHHYDAIDTAAARLPVMPAANTSVGVNIMLDLVESTARRLPEADIEVIEIHHRHKRDAPSGTALALGEAIVRGAGARRAVYGRSGDGEPRQVGEVGFGALRGGEVPGEHTVYFFSDHERLEITHRSASKDLFADGALRAAKWLVGQPAGRYRMADVLG